MVRVMNTGRAGYDFLKKGGKVSDGVPETVHIAPGETADLDVDTADPRFAAAVAFGNLEVNDSTAAKVADTLSTDPPPQRKKL